jgi:hypothetical protein
MKNYSKTGGILSIVAGGLGILWGLLVVLGISFFAAFWVESTFPGGPGGREFALSALAIIYGILAGFYMWLGVLGVVGGTFALRKKYWGWALAGSIAATITFFPCGVAAIIFTAMGKEEFEEG